LGDSIVQKSRFLAAAFFLAGCSAALVLASGCGERESRAAGQELSDASHQALRLMNQVQGLVRPVLVDASTDQTEPFTIRLPSERAYENLSEQDKGRYQSKLRVRPPLAVNPKAWTAIRKAEKILTQAIAARGKEAEARDLADARFLLARVEVLKGDYQAFTAQEARARAYATAALADARLREMQARAVLIPYYNSLRSLADTDTADVAGMRLRPVADIRKEASERLARAKSQKAELEGELRRLTAKRDELTRQCDAANAKASNLRVQSQLAAGEKAVRLYENALAVQRSANKLEADLAETNSAIESKRLQLRWAQMRLQEAGDRLAGIEGAEGTGNETAILAAWKRDRQIVEGKLAKLTAAMTRGRTDVEGLITRLAAMCRQAAAAEKDAQNAYVYADKELRASLAGADAGKIAERHAHRGDVAMQMGEIELRRMEMQGRLAALAANVEALWGKMGYALPLNLSQIRDGYLPAVGQAKSSAVKRFQEAAGFYRDAMQRRGRRRPAWPYRFRIAKALFGEFQVTQDKQVRDAASEELDEALRGAGDSPHAEELRALQRAFGAAPAG
jgi:hypothetical protein